MMTIIIERNIMISLIMRLSWRMRMRSGLQVSEYDSYDYELSKNGISEERTDGAYILVKYCKPQP